MFRLSLSFMLAAGLLILCLFLWGVTPWADAQGLPGAALPPPQPTRPPTALPTAGPETPLPTTPPAAPSPTAGLPGPVPTVPAVCDAAFGDVVPANYFFPAVRFLACQRIVSGYGCGGPGEPCDPHQSGYFRPGANTTRAQLAKMASAGMSWALAPPALPTFADVPASHPFYRFVETAAAHGLVSGYDCGGPGEPCDAQQRPYFRPGANVTRGQLAKILTGARGWAPRAPADPTFADVPPGSAFYTAVETAVAHGLISGYTCGGPDEPCDGANRPYFRSGLSASRGQLSKILYLTLTSP